MSEIIDRVVGREAVLAAKMRSMHPLVETYLQSLDKDDNLTFRPVSDQYFIGKLDFNAEDKEHSLLKGDSVPNKITGKISQLYSIKYLPGGFAQMLVVDGHFDKKNYQFDYARREFLGQIRTLVFDVMPKKGSQGTFKGRIWVEDKDYNVVRFNGTYGPSTSTKMYFHFDSWREYMGPECGCRLMSTPKNRTWVTSSAPVIFDLKDRRGFGVITSANRMQKMS